MPSRWRVRWVVGGAVVLVLTLVAAFQLLSPGERDTADQIGSVLSAAAGWIAVWAVAGTRAGRADGPEDVLDRLADLVGRQWEREAVRRGCAGPRRCGSGGGSPNGRWECRPARSPTSVRYG